MSTVGVTWSTVGGYHDARGGVQYRGGTQITKDFFSTVLNTPGTHDIPTCIMISIPHGTQDNPHGTQDIPTS